MPITAPVGGTNLVVTVATTTFSVPYPATPAATDILVMRLTLNTTTALSTPAGWTSVANLTATGATTPRVAVFIKQATGSESGSLAVTTPSTTGQARIYKVSGVDTTTPQDVAAATISLGATTAYNFGTITTVTPGALLFGLVGSNAASGTFTPPTNLGTWTEPLDVNTVTHSSDAYLIWGSAGATGTTNFVRSASVRGAGALIALRPLVDAQPPRNVRASNPAVRRSYTY